MEATDKPTSSNDFAVAKALNGEVQSIIALILRSDVLDLPEDYEIDELNRAYVLLVHELEKLYSRNPELAEIKPAPYWEQFDVLKNKTWEIMDYSRDSNNDMGEAHIARLDRLCIISGQENPEFSPEQKKLLERISKAAKEYGKKIDEAHLDKNVKIDDSWYIPKYWLDYTDGTILINDVLKLKKTHIDSTIDQLLEQAFKNQNTLFTPELPQTARNLSTVLSSAGFTYTLRQLFFPTVSKSKGVLFRPSVSNVQASKDKIDTTKLDLVLRALGADITFSE